MTTIRIKESKDFSKTEFKNVEQFLKFLAEDSGDYSAPNFEDTKLTDAEINEAKEAKAHYGKNPDDYFEI